MRDALTHFLPQQRGVLVSLCWTLVVALPIVSYPIGYDQSVYAYIGEGILNGFVPYRDAWAQNFPGNFFLYALGFLVFGAHPRVINLLAVVESLVGVLLVHRLTSLFLGRRYATLSASLYGILALTAGAFNEIAEPEAFMALSNILSLLFVVWASMTNDEEDQALWSRTLGFFLGGLFSGLTMLFKPTGIATLVAVLIWLYLIRKALPRHRLLFGLLAFFVGFILPVGATAAYFSLSDNWLDFWRDAILHNRYYVFHRYDVSFLGHTAALLRQSSTLGPFGPLAILGLLLLLQRLRGDLHQSLSRLLLWWTVVTSATVFVQTNNWSYHLHYALPLISILASYGMLNLSVVLKHNRVITYLIVTAATIYAGIFMLIQLSRLPQYYFGLAMTFGMTDASSALNGFPVFYAPAGEAYQIAAYVAERTAPEDAILAMDQLQIYFLSHRRAPTKYFHPGPLAFNDPAVLPQARAEFLKDLQSRPPHYIVVHRFAKDTFLADPQIQRQVDISEELTNGMLRGRYTLEHQVGIASIFRRVTNGR